MDEEAAKTAPRALSDAEQLTKLAVGDAAALALSPATRLLVAVAGANDETVSDIVSAGPRALADRGVLTTHVASGMTALHIAAAIGSAQSALALLEWGICGTLDRDQLGRTPLHVAAASGHEAVAAILAQPWLARRGSRRVNGAAPSTSPSLSTPLTANSGCRDMVSPSIRRSQARAAAAAAPAPADGADTARPVRLRASRCGASTVGIGCASSAYDTCALARDHLFLAPIHAAAILGHTKVVSTIAAAAPDTVTLRDVWGRLPLHLAAAAGHTATVLELAGRGSALDAVDNFGNTAVHRAAIHGHTGTVIALVERLGCSLARPDTSGNTPINEACLGDAVGVLVACHVLFGSALDDSSVARSAEQCGGRCMRRLVRLVTASKAATLAAAAAAEQATGIVSGPMPPPSLRSRSGARAGRPVLPDGVLPFPRGFEAHAADLPVPDPVSAAAVLAEAGRMGIRLDEVHVALRWRRREALAQWHSALRRHKSERARTRRRSASMVLPLVGQRPWSSSMSAALALLQPPMGTVVARCKPQAAQRIGASSSSSSSSTAAAAAAAPRSSAGECGPPGSVALPGTAAAQPSSSADPGPAPKRVRGD